MLQIVSDMVKKGDGKKRVGIIHEHHGAHVFPDRSAEGSKEGRHLYSVRFTAEALWGKNAAGRNAVYVDLWEDYLEPAR